MSADGHIADRAPGLASLPDGDPERTAAEEHAAICPPCAKALADGHALLALLGDAESASPPSAAALARAMDKIAGEVERPRRLVAAPLALVAWGVIVAAARHRVPGNDAWMMSMAGAAVAAAGAAAAAWLGGRVLPVLVAASGLLAFLVGGGGGLAPEVGVHCVLTELAGAAIAVVPTLLLARRSTPGFLAAIAAAGAVAGHAALNLACPARADAPHLWVFHTGGVVLAAMLALGAARLVKTDVGSQAAR
jgi:hypothetical protein